MFPANGYASSGSRLALFPFCCPRLSEAAIGRGMQLLQKGRRQINVLFYSRCIGTVYIASPWLYIVHTLVYQATIQKASAFYFGLSLICAVVIAHFPGQSSFPMATVFILSSASHSLQYFPFLGFDFLIRLTLSKAVCCR
jgi:hypothetical protein